MTRAGRQLEMSTLYRLLRSAPLWSDITTDNGVLSAAVGLIISSVKTEDVSIKLTRPALNNQLLAVDDPVVLMMNARLGNSRTSTD